MRDSINPPDNSPPFLQFSHKFAFSLHTTLPVGQYLQNYAPEMILRFPEIITDSGRAYRPQTGHVIVPYTGPYVIMFSITRGYGDKLRVSLVANGTHVSSVHGHRVTQIPADGKTVVEPDDPDEAEKNRGTKKSKSKSVHDTLSRNQVILALTAGSHLWIVMEGFAESPEQVVGVSFMGYNL